MHDRLTNPNAYTPAMKAATRRLRQEKIFYEVLTAFHIKVGDLNFYPGRGTIYRDGDQKALTKNGLDAFIEVARPHKRTDDNLHYLEIKEQQLEDEDAGPS